MMIIVSVCGASGSGKTCLAANITKQLEADSIKVQMLTIDSYYICHPELSFEERTVLNYDTPEAFDFELLIEDINLLAQGKPITEKRYDYETHLRKDCDTLIYPPQVLIVEGIHAFANKDIMNLSDLRIFVDTDSDVCAVRRMCRDTKSRKRTVDEIAWQYLDTVKPMFEHLIRFYRNDADICIVGGGENSRAIEVITLYVKNKLVNG